MTERVYNWRLYSDGRKTTRTASMTEKEAQVLNSKLPKGQEWKKEPS